MARPDRSDQLRELASVLYRLMREHEAANTTRLKITGPLSRLLEHSPEYRALRGRKKRKSDGRIAKDPSFFTIVETARQLNLPVCAFTPSIEHQPITDPQRKVL